MLRTIKRVLEKGAVYANTTNHSSPIWGMSGKTSEFRFETSHSQQCGKPRIPLPLFASNRESLTRNGIDSGHSPEFL